MATLTVYPDAVPSTTCDGRVRRTTEATWANARDNATGDFAEVSPASFSIRADKVTTFNVFVGFYLFDTSALTSGATISGAVMSLFEQVGGTVANTDTTASNIIETAPASNTTLDVGDFDSRVFTNLGAVNLASWNVNAYTDHTLNATGLTKISKTGITKLGCTIALDVSNTEPTGPNGPDDVAGASGSTGDPKLVITYATSTTGASSLLNLLGVT